MSTYPTWRTAAQRIIAPIEAEYRDKPLAKFKRALREAYPFGQRAYHPYKIWCSEQARAIARHPENCVGQGEQVEFASTEGLLC